jgi:hypothetical protein
MGARGRRGVVAVASLDAYWLNTALRSSARYRAAGSQVGFRLARNDLRSRVPLAPVRAAASVTVRWSHSAKIA